MYSVNAQGKQNLRVACPKCTSTRQFTQTVLLSQTGNDCMIIYAHASFKRAMPSHLSTLLLHQILPKNMLNISSGVMSATKKQAINIGQCNNHHLALTCRKTVR